jgi:hypothetical protein
MKYALLMVCLFAVACTSGGNVDREAPSFVDSSAPPTVQKEIPTTQPETIVNQTSPDFVPPPENYTQNATITIDEKQAWIGKDLVKIWVWNERGSQQLLMAEGTGASIAKLKVNVEVAIVGPEDGGEVQLLVNGQKTKVLNEKEEQKIGNTWVFISDVFLSSPQ